MSQKNKITLFATTDLTYDQRLQKIASSLSKNGFDVLLVGRKLKDSKALPETHFKQKRLSCVFNKGVLFYLEFNIRICFFLWLNKSNIVTANDLDTVLGVYYGTKFSDSHLVFDAHELFTEVPELKGKKRKKAVWSWVENKYIPKFNKHYTVNKSLAKIFKEKLDIDFGMVRNISVLEKQKKLYKKNKEQYILYQGALNKARGLEAIIKAMPKLSLNLKLAGDGDVKAELVQLVKELNLENKVEFLGKIEPKKLKEITRNAFIGVNLLENLSLNYYYSLANKFFDYIHAEIPQVCMNFPEYKILNEEKEVAVLIKNLDDRTVVQAIKKLQEENYYKELQRNCKVLKQKYTWQEEEKNLICIYESL